MRVRYLQLLLLCALILSSTILYGLIVLILGRSLEIGLTSIQSLIPIMASCFFSLAVVSLFCLVSENILLRSLFSSFLFLFLLIGLIHMNQTFFEPLITTNYFGVLESWVVLPIAHWVFLELCFTMFLFSPFTSLWLHRFFVIGGLGYICILISPFCFLFSIPFLLWEIRMFRTLLKVSES